MLTEHPQGTSLTVMNKTDVVLVLMELTSSGRNQHSTINLQLCRYTILNYEKLRQRIKCYNREE